MHSRKIKSKSFLPPDPKHNDMTIGRLDLPPKTPNPVFTYQNYWRLIQSQKFVDLIGLGFEKLDLNLVRDLDQLAPTGLEDGNHEGKGRITKPNLKYRTKQRAF